MTIQTKVWFLVMMSINQRVCFLYTFWFIFLGLYFQENRSSFFHFACYYKGNEHH